MKTGDGKPAGVELSDLQRFLVKSQDIGGDQMVCSVAIGGRIPTQDDILSTVKAVQMHHCILRSMMFLDSDGILRLREHKADASNVSDILTMHDNEAWRDVADRCLNEIHFPQPTEGKPSIL